MALLRSKKPHIVVATPTRVLKLLEKGALPGLKESLLTLVLDEADLLLSYGYSEDVRALLQYLPQLRQTFMMSATLSEELEELKNLVTSNPAVLDIKHTRTDNGVGLRQFYVECREDKRFLILYGMIKLNILSGKTLIFVNSIETCYRLKLLLETFSITCAVLNSELPVNSRLHLLTQYNRGLFDFLIVTDEAIEVESKSSNGKEATEDSEEEQEEADQKQVETSEDFGVARGFDFKNVQTVVNYDLPPTNKQYTHRIGRTARGGQAGDAVSLVTQNDKKIFKVLQVEQPKLKELPLVMKDINALAYRVEDMAQNVTKKRVKAARLTEIRIEMLNSEKLQAHWEDNPKELALLQHTGRLSRQKIEGHLQSLPGYLKPTEHVVIPGGLLGANRRQKKRKRLSSYKYGSRKQEQDPLKSLKPFEKAKRVPFKKENKKRRINTHGRKKVSKKVKNAPTIS
jgi:ATP-dependent RNA helicase DDX56/DBP9